MVFSSVTFLFYFLPITLLLYFIVPYKFKNITLLIASLFFFAWGAPKFVFILIVGIVIDFFIGNKIFKLSEKSIKKKWLIASIFLNLGLLAYFKYANFFIENFNDIISLFGVSRLKWMEIVLPIGISFFTFQKMSYIIDIYKSGKKPLKNIHDFALYILLFPQLIAGPIIRYHEIADQIIDRKKQINLDNQIAGFQRFIIGLSKKMLIANAMGLEVDKVFTNGFDQLGMLSAWLVILAYAFQIYFDFSGYSDMAIGLGRMMGFKIPENFKYPYISTSIRDFWKRWHISLTTWFRDYLFLPLAYHYSRKFDKPKYFNLKADYTVYTLVVLITFLLTGFWHGAAWTFVFWGLYHGILLAVDRLFLYKWLKKLPKPISLIITLIFVLFGWVLFRADNFGQAVEFSGKMLSFSVSHLEFSKHFYTMFVVAIFFSIAPIFKKIEKGMQRFFSTESPWYSFIIKHLVSLLLLFLCMSEIVSTGFNPFIYFRF